MQTSLIVLAAVFGVALLVVLFVLFFVSRRSQKVMESLLLLLTRPERAKVADAARVLQIILNDEVSKIENNFKSMQETLALQITDADQLRRELSVHNETIVGVADVATKNVATMTGRLENTVNGLQEIVASVGWLNVEKSTDNFANRVNDLLNKIDTTAGDAVSRAAQLQDQIEHWIKSGRELSEQLSGAVEINVGQFQTMQSESETMQQKLNDLSGSVVDGFNNVKTVAADYESVMAKNDELLSSQIGKMDTFTKQSKTQLNNQMNTLTNAANVVGGQIRLTESSIEKQIRNLTSAAEQMMDSASGCETAVRNVSTELSGLTNRFNSEIKEFATGVVGELQTVSGVANTTLEGTKSAAGAFSESVRAMATGVRETLIEMNAAHVQLTEQSAGLIKISAETTSQLEPLSELIERYYVMLPDMSSGSVELASSIERIVIMMNERIAQLRDTVAQSVIGITESSVKLDALSGQSRQQMIDLMSDYAKATDTMQTLNKQMMVARATAPMDAIRAAPATIFAKISSADFIKQSEKQIENLHANALDLTRATGADIPDAIWKKYHSGDKTIFSKWLAKMLSAADKKQVKNMMKSDGVFRSQAAQFVRGFDKLLDGAKMADNTEVLIDTLFKTDLGAVYLVLK